jgi:hypothetical protein
MVIPISMYGSELWIPKKREVSQTQASEMRFLRYVKGRRKIDHRTNEDIRNELGVFPVNGNIQ